MESLDFICFCKLNLVSCDYFLVEKVTWCWIVGWVRVCGSSRGRKYSLEQVCEPPTKAATKHAQLLLVQTLHHLCGENRTSLLATEACMQAVHMVQGAQAWWSLCCIWLDNYCKTYFWNLDFLLGSWQNWQISQYSIQWQLWSKLRKVLWIGALWLILWGLENTDFS